MALEMALLNPNLIGKKIEEKDEQGNTTATGFIRNFSEYWVIIDEKRWNLNGETNLDVDVFVNYIKKWIIKILD